jgi:hypothetical protein
MQSRTDRVYFVFREGKQIGTPRLGTYSLWRRAVRMQISSSNHTAIGKLVHIRHFLQNPSFMTSTSLYTDCGVAYVAYKPTTYVNIEGK